MILTYCIPGMPNVLLFPEWKLSAAGPARRNLAAICPGRDLIERNDPAIAQVWTDMD